MAKYMLVLRDDGDYADVSPEEMQQVIQRYRTWAQRLGQAGKYHGRDKLRDGEGRVVRRNGAKPVVNDGPYSETKEVLGGYFLIDASGYDEAARLSADCPHLDFGSIEIREIEPP